MAKKGKTRIHGKTQVKDDPAMEAAAVRSNNNDVRKNRRNRDMAVVNVLIPLWYRGTWGVLKRAIVCDWKYLDNGFEDKESKRAASKLHKLVFERTVTHRTHDEVHFNIPPGTLSDKLNEIEMLVAERGAEYNDPNINFEITADLQAITNKCEHRKAKVALGMIMLKVARLILNPTHEDSWRDIAGYALCGIAVTQPKPHERTDEHEQ